MNEDQSSDVRISFLNTHEDLHENNQQDLNQEEDQGPNLLIHANISFGKSPQKRLISTFVPACKIIATAIVIVNIPTLCESLSYYWVLGMLTHDFLSLWIPIIQLKNLARVKRIYSNSSRLNNQRDWAFSDQDWLNMTHERRVELIRQHHQQELQQLSLLSDSIQILKSTKTIQFLMNLCTVIWGVLILVGIYSIAFTPPISACTNTETKVLMNIYLAMGLLWIFKPIVLFAIVCISFPFILIIYWIFGPKPKRASDSIIKKLPVKPYNSSLPGEKECSVCLVDYVEGEKVVILACDERHYFHEDCGKKWLKINGQCPICRRKVDPES